MTYPDKTKLNKLISERNRLELSIEWLKFCINSPLHYISDDMQKLRQSRLVILLKELVIISELIVNEEHYLQELFSIEETKCILSNAGAHFYVKNCKLFINHP